MNRNELAARLYVEAADRLLQEGENTDASRATAGKAWSELRKYAQELYTAVKARNLEGVKAAMEGLMTWTRNDKINELAKETIESVSDDYDDILEEYEDDDDYEESYDDDDLSFLDDELVDESYDDDDDDLSFLDEDDDVMDEAYEEDYKSSSLGAYFDDIDD